MTHSIVVGNDTVNIIGQFYLVVEFKSNWYMYVYVYVVHKINNFAIIYYFKMTE